VHVCNINHYRHIHHHHARYILPPRSLPILTTTDYHTASAHTTRHPGATTPASHCDERRRSSPTTAGRASCGHSLTRYSTTSTHRDRTPGRLSLSHSYYPNNLHSERGWLAAPTRLARPCLPLYPSPAAPPTSSTKSNEPSAQSSSAASLVLTKRHHVRPAAKIKSAPCAHPTATIALPWSACETRVPHLQAQGQTWVP
jgi:hypothetical protein